MSDDIRRPAATYRVPRDRGLDRGTQRLAMIAGGLGAAMLLVIGVWSAAGHHGGAVPVIEPDSRPLRVKPENAGGMQVVGQNDEILSGDSGPQDGKLAPPPETPEPQALRAQEQARKPDAVSPIPAAAPAPTASAPVAATPPAPPPAPVKSAPLVATAAPPAVATPGKGPLVQLGALESEDAAHTEWKRLDKRLPGLLDGRQPVVQKAERDGHPLWRLRTGGFADIGQATVFCEKVRAKGIGCTIASF